MYFLIPIAIIWSVLGVAQVRITIDPAVCQLAPSLPSEPMPSLPDAVAKDAFCAKRLLDREAPQGVVTVFGSARLSPEHPSYRLTRQFAFLWTKTAGHRLPILTGGGRGLMEAANRGAREASGKSLGIRTLFSQGQESANPYMTNSYVATDFAQREAILVDYAEVVVVAPGGFGTEWELFETLSKIQTKKKKAVPIILLGDARYWETLQARLRQFAEIGTIAREDLALVKQASTAEEAVRIIENFKHPRSRP